MSNQFTIQAGLPVHGTAETAAPSRAATPNAAQTSGQAPQTGPAPHTDAQTPVTKPVALFVNPSFRFDPTTGLVVIEFHDSSGTVSNTIPSQRQLAAYRMHREANPGEPPSPAADGKTSPG